MESFKRSLRYLWPYRWRLFLGLLCIIAISVLWGGGLGLLGPVAEVIISDEGIHGWARESVVSDRVDLEVMLMKVPPGTEIEPEKSINPVLDVAKAKEDSHSYQAGIREGEWLVGVYDQDPAHRVMRGDELSRLLASGKGERQVDLRVFSPLSRRDRHVSVVLRKEDLTLSLFARIVSLVPEPKDRADKYRIFLALLAIALGMTYLRDVFRFIQEYLVETAVYRGIIDIRSETYNVALHLPVTFYSEKGTTDTMSRFVRDTHALARAQVTLFGKTLAEPAKAVGVLVMAFLLSWQLTLLALIAGPPAAILIRKFGKRMRRASKKALEGWADLLAILEETLTGIRVVKAYTMEGTEKRRFFRANRRLYGQQKRMAKIDAATGPAVEALGITAASCAAALAGYWVLYGHMRTSRFLAVMGCLAALFDPVRKLAKVINRFQRADAAAARIFELQDRQQEKSTPGAPALGQHSRDIELKDVTFRYPNTSEDVLRGVDLKIDAGRSLAIVGPNGCGKTTLVSLIPRLIDPSAGRVLIDGQDVSEYSLRSLRRQIALVTQDTVLFNATIAENIAYGVRRPREADVLAAAKQAFVDEFVRELPDGYETIVGQHGATMSGGQRQRIAIARAILRDPAILIFDEATSQIDSDSEKRIHQAMEGFVTGRTTLMIAHRFATVLQAGRIVVMDDGRIVAVGEHEQLLESCALYRHLYETQLGQTTR